MHRSFQTRAARVGPDRDRAHGGRPTHACAHASVGSRAPRPSAVRLRVDRGARPGASISGARAAGNAPRHRARTLGVRARFALVALLALAPAGALAQAPIRLPRWSAELAHAPEWVSATDRGALIVARGRVELRALADGALLGELAIPGEGAIYPAGRGERLGVWAPIRALGPSGLVGTSRRDGPRASRPRVRARSARAGAAVDLRRGEPRAGRDAPRRSADRSRRGRPLRGARARPGERRDPLAGALARRATQRRERARRRRPRVRRVVRRRGRSARALRGAPPLRSPSRSHGPASERDPRRARSGRRGRAGR